MRRKEELEKMLDNLNQCSCTQSLPYVLKEVSELFGEKDRIYFADNINNFEAKKDYIKRIISELKA